MSPRTASTAASMRRTTSSRPSSVVSRWMASGARVRGDSRPRGVGVVALADLPLDGVEVGRHAALRELLLPARRALARMGVHVELHVGVGEDGGADVAAVHDHAALPAHLALARDQAPPHGADARRRARRPSPPPACAGPRSRPRRRGPPRLRARGATSMRVGEGGQRLRVVEVHARAQGGQGERAVHGAGVEEDVAELLRHPRGRPWTCRRPKVRRWR